jgi:hypothetical protein
MEYKGIVINGSDAYNVNISLTRPTVRTLLRIKWSVYHVTAPPAEQTRQM